MPSTLFQELKRRNVFRVGAAYVVVGWLLIQASDVIAPQLHLPEWAPRLVTFLIILGFPLALFLAWVFELTPQGVQVTEGQVGNKRFYALLSVLTVIALGWFLVGLRDDAEPVVGAPVATGPPSIAVLAFENMSPDPENAHFADGIAEEILNILAGIEGLRVASRTSAFSFRGGSVPIPEIARVLNVGHVLEGSVRRQGRQVRITAQLIRADTDEHLWSRSYDRDLTDIFRVQEEIGQAIADALGEVLGTRTVQVVPATADLDAYDRFLRGRARFHQRKELLEAIEDLSHAVEQDAEFGEAWAYLAAAHLVSPGYLWGEVSEEEAHREGRVAVERARRLVPEHPMVLGVQGMLQIYGGDHQAGVEFLRRAAESASQDSTPVMWHGLNLLLAGYIDEAIVALERSRTMDPLVGINRGYLSVAYLSAGREEAAELEARRGQEHGWGAAVFILALELAARGERERAAVLLRSLVIPIEAFAEIQEHFIEAVLDPSLVPSYLARIEDDWVPEELMALGEFDAYLDRLEAAVDSGRLPYGTTWLRLTWLPSASPLREDPRYFRVAQEIGLVRLWEARGYPPGCMRLASPDGDRLDCPGMRR
jgi:adenylate cyclase